EDLAWTTSQLGDLSFNEGDLRSAARSYRRAMQVAPDFVAAHAGMANVDTARGHLRAAVAGYEWVVARYPLPQYVIALGDLYSRTGNDALANQEYRLLGLEEQLFRANGVDMDLEVAQFDADHHVDLVNGLAAAR